MPAFWPPAGTHCQADTHRGEGGKEQTCEEDRNDLQYLGAPEEGTEGTLRQLGHEDEGAFLQERQPGDH